MSLCHITRTPRISFVSLQKALVHQGSNAHTNTGTDKDAMSRLVQENDLVVSVLPATMHVRSVRARSARIILVSISHVIHICYITQITRKSLGCTLEKIIIQVRECAKFLGSGISSFDSKTKMEAFSNLLADRLVYNERERDMVAMHHEFGVELADGTRETRTSSLLAYGDPDGDTSMAKTVGITAAIGAQLLLNGDIRDRGVLIPTKPSVYVPGLRMLKEEGFEFKES